MILLLSLLAACGAERGLREAPAEVTYGGWVYDSLLYEAVFADGTLTFTVPTAAAPEGEALAADQPYEGYDGYWLATLPPNVPFALRLLGEGTYPTVWAGDTPGANGTWFAGALFATKVVDVDALLAGLDLPKGLVPGALSAGAVHLWGRPFDGTDWDCATVTVNGAAPLCYLLEEDGTLTRTEAGPFDMFFAFDLAPGEIVLMDGFGGGEAWTAAEGDLVMAWWMVHG
ncbi:MAG: hypothetical protein Q8P18_05300 [Pseudomonadota bacterium]|nr:hypothetical protein [Pseudomonadota bacterium]